MINNVNVFTIYESSKTNTLKRHENFTDNLPKKLKFRWK